MAGEVSRCSHQHEHPNSEQLKVLAKAWRCLGWLLVSAKPKQCSVSHKTKMICMGENVICMGSTSPSCFWCFTIPGCFHPIPPFLS